MVLIFDDFVLMLVIIALCLFELYIKAKKLEIQQFFSIALKNKELFINDLNHIKF